MLLYQKQTGKCEKTDYWNFEIVVVCFSHGKINAGFDMVSDCAAYKAGPRKWNESVRVFMNTQRFIYWQDEEFWLGYLEEYPDYWTQGETLEELKKNLRDIIHSVTPFLPTPVI